VLAAGIILVALAGCSSESESLRFTNTTDEPVYVAALPTAEWVAGPELTRVSAADTRSVAFLPECNCSVIEALQEHTADTSLYIFVFDRPYVTEFMVTNRKYERRHLTLGQLERMAWTVKFRRR